MDKHSTYEYYTVSRGVAKLCCHTLKDGPLTLEDAILFFKTKVRIHTTGVKPKRD